MDIAVDNPSGAATSTTSPLTYASTAVGAGGSVPGEHLYVAVGSHATASYATPSAVSYAGVAMTMIEHVQANDGTHFFDLSIWSLQGPATGSNTVSVTWSGGTGPSVMSCANSYTGVAPTDAIDGTHGTNSLGTGSGGHITANVTPVSDRSWILSACVVSRNIASPTITADAGLTNRNANLTGATRMRFNDSNGPITPAAATTEGWTSSGSSTFGILFTAIAIAPYLGASQVAMA